MEFEDLFELLYKCKQCDFCTTADDEIKEHIVASHQWLLSKMQKLSEPVLQDPNRDKTWKDLFQVTPHLVTKTILGSLDHESFLACRLVCQGWRRAVNTYKPTWNEIKEGSFQSSLSNAIWNGHELVTEMLISNAANVLMRPSSFGFDQREPLHIATKVGKLSLVQMLISNGANVNAIEEDEWNTYTPLLIAAERNDLSIVEILVSYGADVNYKNRDNDTPLHLASK